MRLTIFKKTTIWQGTKDLKVAKRGAYTLTCRAADQDRYTFTLHWHDKLIANHSTLGMDDLIPSLKKAKQCAVEACYNHIQSMKQRDQRVHGRQLTGSQFSAHMNGKSYEVVKSIEPYTATDYLVFSEVDDGKPTGRTMVKRINHITQGNDENGIMLGYSVIALR